LVVQPRVAKALDEQVVYLLKDRHFFGRNLAQDANRQAWPREGMAAKEFGL